MRTTNDRKEDEVRKDGKEMTGTDSTNVNAREDTMKKLVNTGRRLFGKKALSFMALGICIIALGYMLSPLSSDARDRMRPPLSSDEIMQRLTEELRLTLDQEKAVRPVIEEEMEKRNRLREEKSAGREDVRSEMGIIRWETERKLDGILTDEQIARYVELRQERHEKLFRRPHRRDHQEERFAADPERVMEHLEKRLGLTEEQAARIEPIIQKSMEKQKDIRDRYRDKGKDLKLSLRTEMKAADDETEKQLSQVISPEQLEEFREIRKEREGRMFLRKH